MGDAAFEPGAVASVGPQQNQQQQPSSTDEHFFLHLERLERSKREAELDSRRLGEMRAGLLQRLREATEERDASGRMAMVIRSEEAELGARKYEYAMQRQALSDRLNRVLADELRLRDDLARVLDDNRNSKVREELIATRNRLLDGARGFENESLDPGYNDQNKTSGEPTPFDVDRATRAVESAKQVLEETQHRLATAQSNELKLREKHRLEQEKNDAMH